MDIPSAKAEPPRRLAQFGVRGLMLATLGVALLCGALRAMEVSLVGVAIVVVVLLLGMAAAGGLAATVAALDESEEAGRENQERGTSDEPD
jgi:hypothetical protein